MLPLVSTTDDRPALRFPTPGFPNPGFPISGFPNPGSGERVLTHRELGG